MDCVVLLHDRTPQGRLARVLTLGLVLLFGLAQPAGADEYHIDSVAGDDATGDGSLPSPVESIS
ncbi:MAG: hypothetical protein IH848_09185, partial [Acidobacteria bacterium]|nr:hypothetical protein [Acidobacteriota bacterium]